MSLPCNVEKIPFQGQSMWPLLRDNDQVLVQMFEAPKEIAEISLGKIVLHRDASEWMIHRVVQKGQRKVLKGDYSNSYFFEDEPVVWGEVVGFERNKKNYQWKAQRKLSKTMARLSGKTLFLQGLRRRLIKSLMFFISQWN